MMAFFCLVLLLPLLIFSGKIPVLDPAGLVGAKEQKLILITTILMCIVVVPVFLLTLFIAWKFPENKQAKYTPKWDFNLILEYLWWGFPLVLIVILSVIGVIACYQLDPFRPIETGAKPLKIQAVALQWKWLFIYPDHGIAAINHVQFPKDVPIHFQITSDAPMNSLWIPALGGQMYAMSGMSSQLHLIANQTGTFRGCSANLSGRGFSGMVFQAVASTEAEFDSWVEEVRASGHPLSSEEYKELAKPSEYAPKVYYSLGQQDLYHWIIKQYE